MNVTISQLPSALRQFAGVLVLTAVLGNAATPMTDRGPTWSAFVTEFLNTYFTANPNSAVQAGRHEFDGRLPDWSPEGLASEIARLKTQRATALAFSADSLNEAQRFERDHLVAEISSQLFWMVTADAPHVNPYYYAGALDPDVYVSREYAPLAERLQAYTRYARAVPSALEQIKANLKGDLAKPLVAIGRLTIGGLADFYEKDVSAVFAPVADKTLQKDFRETNAAAIKAVRSFDAWLGEKEKTATADFALGEEKFRAMVRETEGVDLPLAELEDIARKDLERNLAALKEASATYAPGKTAGEAMAMAYAQKPTGTVVQYATQQLEELQQFVIKHDLVTIPSDEKALVAEAPAYKRWNFAYIVIPGPYERGLPSVYYVAPPDPAWAKQKQDEYIPGVSSLLFTSAHEVWPGHFLHFLHANRVSSEIGRVFVGYGFAEGWAHYTEELMWEAGLGEQSPEIHIGQLQEALLRNVRFIASIGLHTKGMTVEEATKLFREKGYQDEASAEQQARRGTFDPGYINYTMGKLMIRKLRDDWTATRGGRKAWKAFHDEFLKYGGPPIPLVRKAMLGAEDKGSLF